MLSITPIIVGLAVFALAVLGYLYYQHVKNPIEWDEVESDLKDESPAEFVPFVETYDVLPEPVVEPIVEVTPVVTETPKIKKPRKKRKKKKSKKL